VWNVFAWPQAWTIKIAVSEENGDHSEREEVSGPSHSLLGIMNFV
jgi:hypothetical protein